MIHYEEIFKYLVLLCYILYLCISSYMLYKTFRYWFNELYNKFSKHKNYNSRIDRLSLIIILSSLIFIAIIKLYLFIIIVNNIY